MKEPLQLIHADCLEGLKTLPAASVDLIVTSPPYSAQRKQTYGGIHPDHYVKWFIPRAEEMRRVLKPTGTFILNIKEKAVRGERHTYVLELILALRAAGWLWTEEFIWHKKNAYPGYWPNRFRDSWERLLQFNKQKKFKMYQEAVRVPIKDSTKRRAQRLGLKDVARKESVTRSGFGSTMTYWQDKEEVLPSNVLYLATEATNKRHSAVFPVTIPSWFIKLFTQEGDLVLDPFIGSGTTAIAALLLNRRCVGMDISEESLQIAHERLQSECGLLM